MNRSIMVLTMGLVGVGVSATHAAVSFEIQPSSVTLTPGAKQTVQLYLHDTGTLISSEQGLYSIGFSISRTGTGTSQITSFTPNSTQFPLVASTPYTVSATNVSYWYEVANGAIQGIAPDVNGRISLGSLELQGAGTVDTQFSFGDYGPGTQSVTWSPEGTFADSQIAPTTLIVSVPEPASLTLLVLGGAGMLKRRRGHCPKAV